MPNSPAHRRQERFRRIPRPAACLPVLLLAACMGVSPPGGQEPSPLPLQVSCGLPDPAANLTHGVHHGRTALRFTLRDSDLGLCRSDLARGDHLRAELRSASLPVGQPIAIRFDLFLPEDFEPTGAIAIGQFHQAPDGPPLILLMASPEGYRAVPGSGLRALETPILTRALLIPRADFGRWHRIEMMALFAQGEEGMIRISANGQTAFEARGKTLARGARPYFKIGLYGRKSRVDSPLTAFVTPPVLHHLPRGP